MNFDLPVQELGTIPPTLLERALAGVIDLENRKGYNFKFGEWLRLDSYNNPENFKLADIAGQELIDHVMNFYPGQVLFGWSISHLPPLKDVIDHVDRMFFHRIAKRIIVPISNTPDVLNWHWQDKNTKRNYFLEYGHVYRLNTAYTHGVKSYNKNVRRAIYFDIMEPRLYNKFINHPDILKVITANASGEKYVF
jgi:hypothetical protein